MCDVCREKPCNPDCPCAPTPQVVSAYCYICDDAIYVGEHFYELNGYSYCEECVSDARKEAVEEWTTKLLK